MLATLSKGSKIKMEIAVIMKRKYIMLPLLVFLVSIIVVIFLLFRNSNYPLEPERVPIPNTDFSLRIPEGYCATYNEKMDMLTIEVAYHHHLYPTFRLFPISFEYLDGISYLEQHKAFVQEKLISDRDTLPRKIKINNVDVYITRFIGEITTEVIVFTTALIAYEEQGVLISASGNPDQEDVAIEMMEAILHSIQIDQTR